MLSGMTASCRLIIDLPEPVFAALAAAAAAHGWSLHGEWRLRLQRSLPRRPCLGMMTTRS
jgi:hypothetical protein